MINFKTITTTLALSAISTISIAEPFLQLDIGGGTYDASEAEQSTITTDDIFTLYALAETSKAENKIGSDWADDWFYVSFAITPNDSLSADVAPDLGSFSVNGTTYDATADMTFGHAPIEADSTAEHDGGDLPSHSIFETYFIELAFQFTGDNESGVYNVAEDVGDVTDYAGTGQFFEEWAVDISNLAEGYGLHFDLYHEKYGSNGDIDIDYNAPFSKDAATGLTRVPEPSSLALLGLGVLGLSLTRRRMSAS